MQLLQELNLLMEIVTKTKKSGDTTIYEPDIEASEGGGQNGIREVSLNLTKEEKDLFKHRYELLQSTYPGFAALSDKDKQDLRSTILPPSKVYYYHAYTLDKNPNSAVAKTKAMGTMSALKGRNTKHVMSDEHVDLFVNSAVKKLLKTANTYKDKAPPRNADSTSIAAKFHESQIYSKFLAPYLNEGSRGLKNSVIVPLSSSSDLVYKFADALEKQLGATIVRDAFIKNSWPELSGHSMSPKTSEDSHYLRVSEAYINKLVDNRDKITVNPAIKTVLDTINDVNNNGKTKAANKVELGQHYDTLRSLIQKHLVDNTINITKVIDQLITLKKDYALYDVPATEYKRYQEYREVVAHLKTLGTARKQIPLPSLEHSQHYAAVKSDLAFINQYITNQIKLGNDVLQAGDFVKKTAAGKVFDLLGNIVSKVSGKQTKIAQRPASQEADYAEIERQHADDEKKMLAAKKTRDTKAQAEETARIAREYKLITDARERFTNSVAELLHAAIYSPFKIHNEYAKVNVDYGKAFSKFMLLRKHCYDSLEGKNIILVDDNVASGQSIGDAVKALYMAGISPKNIVCFTPHYFKSGNPSVTAAEKKKIEQATSEFNTEEKANKPEKVLSRDAALQRIKDLQDIADIPKTEKAGTHRAVSKHIPR